jgi:hypothetical protein
MPVWKIDRRDTNHRPNAQIASAVPLKWAHDAKTGEPRYITRPVRMHLSGLPACFDSGDGGSAITQTTDGTLPTPSGRTER